MNAIIKIICFLSEKLLNNKIRISHIIAFFEYNNLHKFLNLLLCEYERIRKKTVLKSKPYLLGLEVTNRCNYRCLFCHTGKKETRNGKTGDSELQTFQTIFEQLGAHAYIVSLHGWGEPLLYKEIDKVIQLAHEKKIMTVISTNASLLNEAASRRIIQSELDFLVVAIDGISKETYDKYRVGGNFEVVIDNLKKFIQIRNSLNSRKPYVEWQFVVFGHNEHEIKQAKRIAKEIGVDNITFRPAGVEMNEKNVDFVPDSSKYKAITSPLSKRSDCRYLWTTATIYYNGDVAACCNDYYADSGFGNIVDTRFYKIWNSEKFQESRKIIKYGTHGIKPSNICYYCVENINRRLLLDPLERGK